jgi:hypothetical protein
MTHAVSKVKARVDRQCEIARARQTHMAGFAAPLVKIPAKSQN